MAAADARAEREEARTEGTSPQPKDPHAQGHYARTVMKAPKPVWVRLDAIAIRARPATSTAPESI